MLLLGSQGKKSKETGKETTKLVLPNFNTFNIFLCALILMETLPIREMLKQVIIMHWQLLACWSVTQKATSEGHFLMETGTL